MNSRVSMQEIRSLFNPAFIAINIHALAEGFTKDGHAGLPMPLAYIAIPLCLHTSTRNMMPSTSAKRFHIWVQENQQILVGFGRRAASMRTRVNQGIIFANSSSLITFTEDGSILNCKKPRGFSKILTSGDIKDCFSASKRMGGMLSKAPDLALVYYMLGVRP
jgi:hypothetical protein